MMILGSAYLAGALLSCVLPISLLICFATFFGRSARRLPPNAAPPKETTPAGSAPTSAAQDPQSAPLRPYSDV